MDGLPRPASASSFNSDHLPTTSTPPLKQENKPTGWAAIAQKAAALPEQDLTPAASPSLAARTFNNPTTVPRNRKGQRIDPPTPEYLRDEVIRLKKLKLCNVHFLKPPCPYGAGCPHQHHPATTPTKKDLEILKLVARMAPCTYGSGCDDPRCIYGHRCPAPEAKDLRALRERGGEVGGKNCIFGAECRFPEELHGMDTTVVKTKVVRG
ncbi:hypothetical protein LTS18_014422 [Coniosporium uncinatum]|uniref:Uncharacterized protein n=1 Tax=Coniosporium uncinatum TaxID=93489 RepID=A0ACC3D8R9_9PEZI|nr:hypothetical protein LTS18_014422 [Coniosporium uncinatum]